MGVTRLKRKSKANKARANNKKQVIKQISEKPVVKNIDIESIKGSFKKKK